MSYRGRGDLAEHNSYLGGAGGGHFGYGPRSGNFGGSRSENCEAKVLAFFQVKLKMQCFLRRKETFCFHACFHAAEIFARARSYKTKNKKECN